jgi:pyridoxine kinase
MRSDATARPFRIDVAAIPCFFSGTGDMFAALAVVRLREACAAAALLGTRAWMSGDEVAAVELPLAKATEKVLASMQAVLEKTMTARDEAITRFDDDDARSRSVGSGGGGGGGGGGSSSSSSSSSRRSRVDSSDASAKQRRYLAETKAAEVRVVRNVADLRCPVVKFKAQALEG